ncbi:methionine--tRNA ligase [Candidatus Woesebacteria bacterium RIFOXYB1_FULL_40_26]|uniref:Methionine--tRNA ligase n=1 Tax=Candidatus Woesebacteria bacterium RIFOXYB1_FULL_40_26 TaxID=1802539 RepID=A0A1F8CY18_9BACT|nr:MAG: methionine--tRNA ligase [Candidatus Woesebacteria bacterium RIFOXYB1_FULL_40_26]
MNKKFYITTTLPYVNAEPHIGFAFEIIQADAIARYHELLGDEVVFNFGTDEHGQKIYQKALEEGKDPQKYCDEYAAKFDALKKALNLNYTNFIRTTNSAHIKAAQEFWKLCVKNDDIYKKFYKIKYCVGCELEKTESELVDGKCPLHSNRDLEIIEEENYFFKFSKYQKPLLDFYKKNPDFVIPESKFNEIKTFVKSGLQDFSISRLKSKMPWGIDIPDDPEQIMYVWFDALINYISTLGWPEDEKKFKDFWPGVQVAGKDNLRQQSAIWQAMLLSAKLSSSKQIFIHGFLTVNGQKISKSLGNVINPIELVKKYGTDPVRYFLLAKVHPFEDSDFTIEKFEKAYNADLANGLGNLVSRVAKLCETSGFGFLKNPLLFYEETEKNLKEYRFDNALKFLWEVIGKTDNLIDKEKPWKLKDKKLKEVLKDLVQNIRLIAHNLKPFLPETADAIEKQFAGPKIKVKAPLFPRLR